MPSITDGLGEAILTRLIVLKRIVNISTNLAAACHHQQVKQLIPLS